MGPVQSQEGGRRGVKGESRVKETLLWALKKQERGQKPKNTSSPEKLEKAV